MSERISKDTLRAKVKKYILKGISTGVYKPGERVVETRISKELDMSQAPVREAILELSIMGVLEERPYSGSFVQPKNPDDIKDYFEIRAILESYTTRIATENITEEELKKLRDILDEMDRCEDLDDFTDLDHDFHGTVVDASKNKVLKRLWMSISAYEWTYMTILSTKTTLEELRESHRELYKAIASGRANSAAANMFLHIDGFKESVMEALKESGQNV